MRWLDYIPKPYRTYVIIPTIIMGSCFLIGSCIGRYTAPIKVQENYPIDVLEQELDETNQDKGTDITVKMRYGERRIFLRQPNGSLRALVDIENEDIKNIRDQADSIRNQSLISE